MNKYLFPITLAALVTFAGCSNDADDAAPSNYPADNVIRVTTRVTPTRTTRADATEAYTGNDFALFLEPIDGNSDFRYENIIFKNDGSNNWLPSNGEEYHWQSKSTKYNYYAYAPSYSSDKLLPEITYLKENNGSIELGWFDYGPYIEYDLSVENIDLLWTSNASDADDAKTAQALTKNEAGALNLTFAHMLAQFKVEVEIGNVLYNNSYSESVTEETVPLTDVSVLNAGGKGYFSLTEGKFTPLEEVDIPAALDYDNVNNVAASNVHDGKIITQPIYIYPGEQSLKISLTINGDKYAYTHTAANYVAGYSYTLKVKVGASSVNGTGITVDEWVDGTDTDNNKLATY
jgi:hypothetical protein